MSTLGCFGKFPYRLGGDPSPQEKAFRAIVALEGAGLLPPDDPQGATTIDGAWHQAMANGLGMIGAVGEAAVFQAWPDRATDYIPEYERVLGISPAVASSEQERRDAITLAWVGDIRSADPDIEASLQAIDSRFSVLPVDHELARQTHYGKLFASQTAVLASPAHGQAVSDYPNYGDDFYVRIFFDVGVGVAATGQIAVLKQQARDHLDRVLPAWCDFSIALSRGFYLTRSLLTEASF